MWLLGAAFLAVGVLLTSQPARAISASDLSGLEVVGHHWSTAIRTPNKMLGVKNPEMGRWIVIRFSAKSPQNQALLFANDFLLKYSHADGKEDRATVDAIAAMEDPHFINAFNAANVPRVTVGQGQIYFALAAYLEGDVDKIEIYRTGLAAPLTYQVGTQRLFSVYVTTNQGEAAVAKAAPVIKQAGFDVFTSVKLAPQTTGNTIHYMQHAEAQARKLAQALESGLGLTFELKKCELVSEMDIVVWLGKPAGQ